MFKAHIEEFINLIMGRAVVAGKLGKIFTTIPFNRPFPYSFIEKIEIGKQCYKNNNKSEFSFVLVCYFAASDEAGPAQVSEEICALLWAEKSNFMLQKLNIQNDSAAKAITTKFSIKMR